MRIGIFFGGKSREREISFAGGRTVYDNLNKELFTAIPIFVDSLGNFILLDWQYIYKGTIRDFYPPVSVLDASNQFQVYIESIDENEVEKAIAEVGKKISPEDLAKLIDFGFLTLHGPYGEDGNIQGLLEWYNIPYSGSGILSSAIGISKSIQKQLMQHAGFKTPVYEIISKNEWSNTSDKKALYSQLANKIGFPMVIKAPNQGSSIGVSILKDNDYSEFESCIEKSLFLKRINAETWNAFSEEDKIVFIKEILDIRVGIGMPLVAENEIINNPKQLLSWLNEVFKTKNEVVLQSVNTEQEVLIEGFISGKEFSCIVIQDLDGKPIALPPTQIVKKQDFFDYRAKYLPGIVRKITPIDLPIEQINAIISECERLYTALNFNVYARLDGFITDTGEVFLNDPNTTSGMLPSSFFFHQAAEIGLNPSQFITYIIRTSIAERLKSGKNTFILENQLASLDNAIHHLASQSVQKTKIAVIMGGYSSERHISVESGRNIFEKLSSSDKYAPIPVFLTGDSTNFQLFILPSNVMLKDNADDIKQKVFSKEETHPVIENIVKKAEKITSTFAFNAIKKPISITVEELATKVDAVFIALHGRPGEDGSLQIELEKFGLPYNGSGVESSSTTIDKYLTNEILMQNGFHVAKHFLVKKDFWKADSKTALDYIETEFAYPFICKPSDDGCSSAVKKIKTRVELEAFCNLIFRETEQLIEKDIQALKVKPNEEFPLKKYFVVEELISRNRAKHFLEITGGLLTTMGANGEINYEIFEPSEALAEGDVLSLEEKFLAGEGQNITPPRFSKDKEEQKFISEQVRNELKKVAQCLNIQGYARIDAFVRIFDNNRAETIIIEINSLPGMTPATCIFHQCAINGYKPYEFIDAILDFGIKRNKLTV
jgi:UDP-N-acetylmuramate--alanine ligase